MYPYIFVSALGSYEMGRHKHYYCIIIISGVGTEIAKSFRRVYDYLAVPVDKPQYSNRREEMFYLDCVTAIYK